jgi:plasmid stability protein
MAVLNLRNVPDELMLALGIAAAQRGIGKHALAIEIIESHLKQTRITATRSDTAEAPFTAPEYMDIEIT